MIDSGTGLFQIPGTTGAAFNTFLAYEYGQAPATKLTVRGLYRVNVPTGQLGVQYQVDPGQNIKLEAF